MTRALHQLPKAHLHMHLEESVRQSTLDDVALARLARTSLEASAAPKELVAAAVAEVDTWLAQPPA